MFMFMAMALILFGNPIPANAAADRILVLSAASAAPAIIEIAHDFNRRMGIVVRVSSGSSGTLARQISQGAPADIYISAAPKWISFLGAEKKLDQNFTRPLMRNRLVVVAPIGSAHQGLINLSKPVALLNRLNGGRLAIGDPQHVPAGHYAKQAMENLGLWPAVRDRLARQINVRAVLAFVVRGESPLGIIYATDAALSDAIRIAAIIPPESHDPIVYTAAVVSEHSRPDVLQFFDSLNQDHAGKVFERYGFGVVRTATDDQISKTMPSMP